MNYRPAAARAAIFLSLVLVPGALYASGGSTGQCTCVDFEEDTRTVSGVTSSLEVERLRHTNNTLHKFIGNPNDIPPGNCRIIAHAWNIGVFLKAKDQAFVNLLRASAANSCKIAFERDSVANEEGTFDLLSVAPSPESAGGASPLSLAERGGG